MTSKINLDDIAADLDLDRSEVARVVVALIRDGWLFSSHVEGDVYEIARQ